MKKKENLSHAERLEIGILLGKQYSLRAIARVLGRGHNTVSYEVRINRVAGAYDPKKADAKARLRKRFRRLHWAKIEANPLLQNLVVEKLEAHWNPDEIAGWLKRMKKYGYVSKTAIYEWLRTSRGERYCMHLYSKRKRVKKRKPRTKKVMVPNRIGIERRNKGIASRNRYKHWERDTIVSRKGCAGGLATHQERKSRLLIGRKVCSMRPAEHAKETRHVARLAIMKSATTDNGTENRDHEQWGMSTFFCDPYSSWQKGGIENANKMLRRYFPKGTDFSTVTQKEIDDACRIINRKPRKILGYRSSLEVAQKAHIIKKSSVLIQG